MSLGRILVVDDEAAVRESVRLVIAQAGYEVIEAEDAAQAMETVRSGDNPSLLTNNPRQVSDRIREVADLIKALLPSRPPAKDRSRAD